MTRLLPDLTRVLDWWRDERRDEPGPGDGGDPQIPAGADCAVSSPARPGFVAGGGSAARAGSAGGRVARDPRRAYRVVDDFESELAHYTGAPYAVAVDSCTNALLLALTWERRRTTVDWRRWGDCCVRLPKRTYVGVMQSALNAGLDISWWGADWYGYYDLFPTDVRDSARFIARDMYLPGKLVCLSFHAAKQLPLGRGGAILTDDAEAADWFRAARMDGRPPGAPIGETIFPGFHANMPPDTAARGLWILSRWVDSGFEPSPLPDEEYPDLSLLHPDNGRRTP